MTGKDEMSGEGNGEERKVGEEKGGEGRPNECGLAAGLCMVRMD